MAWPWNRKKDIENMDAKFEKFLEKRAAEREKRRQETIKRQEEERARKKAEREERERYEAELVARTDVPGWKLESYISSGAYGNVFRAVEDASGNLRVVKVYELSPDAIDDMKRVYKLPDDFNEEHYLAALEKAIAREWMAHLRKHLSAGEQRHILLPEKIIPGATASDGKKTLAAVSRRIQKILDKELAEGKYSNPSEYLPLVREIIKSVAIVHKPRPDPSTGKMKRRVHNDIKPSNIGLDHLERAVLFDFGIAQTMCSHDVGVYENVISLQMRDPEIGRHGPMPTTRSDVWQIGCIIAYIALRKHPFDNNPRPRKGEPGRSIFERRLPRAVRKEAPKVIRQMRRANVLSEIVEIVERCLSFKNRYENAEEVLDDLNEMSREARASLRKKYMPEALRFRAAEIGLEMDEDLHGSETRLGRLSKRIAGRMCEYLVFPSYKSGLAFSPKKTLYTPDFPPDAVYANPKKNKHSHEELVRFLDTYEIARCFQFLVGGLNGIERFWKRGTDEQQKIVDENLEHLTGRNDLSVKVGYPDIPKCQDSYIGQVRYADEFANLMDEYRDVNLRIYAGNNGGFIASADWWVGVRTLNIMEEVNGSLNDSLLSGEPFSGSPLYAIAVADDPGIAEEASSRLIEKIACHDRGF